MKHFEKILKELQEENLAVFLGAGFSIPAGFVSWKELLKNIASELELDIDKETDLISLAQYHYNTNNSRAALNQCIVESFSSQKKPTENHKILTRLPIKEFWTTNYDKLIEKSQEDTGKIADVKYTNDQLAHTKRKRDCIIYKMHGDVEHPNNTVLTKDDYEKYYKTHEPFITALSGAFVSKTFLFIGFSFTDPNIDYILSRIRVHFTTGLRQHFFFSRKVKENDYQSPEEFQYALIKQKLFIEDLKRFSIYEIPINDYSEVTEYLSHLESTYKRKTVFISGAADNYGKDIDTSIAKKFIKNLANKLIENEYKIVSGFGLGVGSEVITGALEELYMKTKHPEIDRLILRPFPQNEESAEREVLWTKYREDMCEYAGVAIFIFGNKLDTTTGKIIESKGMEEEFKIAKKKNLFLIPIGATGFISEKLYNYIATNLENYGYNTETLKTNFAKLQKSNLDDDLIAIIIAILNEVIHKY